MEVVRLVEETEDRTEEATDMTSLRAMAEVVEVLLAAALTLEEVMVVMVDPRRMGAATPVLPGLRRAMAGAATADQVPDMQEAHTVVVDMVLTVVDMDPLRARAMVAVHTLVAVARTSVEVVVPTLAALPMVDNMARPRSRDRGGGRYLSYLVNCVEGLTC